MIGTHTNEQTLRTPVLSDELIADKCGGKSERYVRKARARLAGIGWLSWWRTGIGNVYQLNFEKTNAMLDLMTMANDARKQRRKLARARLRYRNASSYLAAQDRNASSYQDRNASSAIHLKDTPSKKEGRREKKDSLILKLTPTKHEGNGNERTGS